MRSVALLLLLFFESGHAFPSGHANDDYPSVGDNPLAAGGGGKCR